MEYVISYTNGEREDRYESYEDAKQAIAARWPDALIGHDGDLNGFGDRTLFWESDADAEDDDGARALGSIRRDER